MNAKAYAVVRAGRIIHTGTHRGCAIVAGRQPGAVVLTAEIAAELDGVQALRLAIAQQQARQSAADLRAAWLSGDRDVHRVTTRDRVTGAPATYERRVSDRIAADQQEIAAEIAWSGGYVQYCGELGRAMLAVARLQAECPAGWALLGGRTDRLVYSCYALFGVSPSAAAHLAEIANLAAREYAAATALPHHQPLMRAWADLLAAATTGHSDIVWCPRQDQIGADR